MPSHLSVQILDDEHKELILKSAEKHCIMELKHTNMIIMVSQM